MQRQVQPEVRPLTQSQCPRGSLARLLDDSYALVSRPLPISLDLLVLRYYGCQWVLAIQRKKSNCLALHPLVLTRNETLSMKSLSLSGLSSYIQLCFLRPSLRCSRGSFRRVSLFTHQTGRALLNRTVASRPSSAKDDPLASC